MDELGNTLAYFTHFQVNITRQVYNYGNIKMNQEIINYTMKNEVDFAVTPKTISTTLLSNVDFTMQLSRQHQKLFVRPIERYITNWLWFFEVIDIVLSE